MPGSNVSIISGLEYVDRRDYYLTIPDILSPLYTGTGGPLVEGEWLVLGTDQKLRRNVTGSAPHEETFVNTFMVWAENGRFDTQAIQKVPVIRWDQFEAVTYVVDTTGLVEGDRLVVKDITFDGIAGRRGLAKATGTGSHIIFGHFIKTVTENNRTGIQFFRVQPYTHVI